MSDDDTGYGKPPKAYQFKPGQSGNLNGRPRKKTSDFPSELRSELNSMVSVREGEKVTRMTKGKAMAKKLMTLALQGNLSAFRMFLSYLPAAEIAAEFSVTPKDEKALEKFIMKAKELEE